MFLNGNYFHNDSDDSSHLKLTMDVRFRHFLMTDVSGNES